MAPANGVAVHGARRRCTAPGRRQKCRSSPRRANSCSTVEERSLSCTPRDDGVRFEDLDEYDVLGNPDGSTSQTFAGFLCSPSAAASLKGPRRRNTSSCRSYTSSVRTRVLATCHSPAPPRRRQRMRRAVRSTPQLQEDTSSISSHDTFRYLEIPERSLDPSSFATRLIQVLTSLKDFVSGQCACSSYLRGKPSLSTGRPAKRPLVTVNVGDAGKERPLLEDCVRGLGWETSTSFFNGGDIRWLGNAVPDYEHAMYVSSSLVVNRFPGLHDVAKKQYFARILSSMQELQPEEYNFFPVTWVLPEDRVALEAVLQTRPKVHSWSSAGSSSFPAAEHIAAEDLKFSYSSCQAAHSNSIQERHVQPSRCNNMYVPLFGAHRDAEFIKRMRDTPKARFWSSCKEKYMKQKGRGEFVISEISKRVPEASVVTPPHGRVDNMCVSSNVSDDVLPTTKRVFHLTEGDDEVEKSIRKAECVEKGWNYNNNKANDELRQQKERDTHTTGMNGRKEENNTCEEKQVPALLETQQHKLHVSLYSPSYPSSDIQQQLETMCSSSPGVGDVFFSSTGLSSCTLESSSTTERLSTSATSGKVMRCRLNSSSLILSHSSSLSRPYNSPLDMKCREENDIFKRDFFILKPDAGAQGMGVRLISSGDTLPSDILEGKDGYIVQQYIADPYLLGGKKFDFRIYVLLLNLSPHPRVKNEVAISCH